MRGLFLYCVIGCLAFATAAPSEEASKVYTKNFTFDNNKEPMLRFDQPFSKNELVYAVCENSPGDKKCEVLVETTNDQDQSTVQTCNVTLPAYTGMSHHEVILTNAGNSRALFAVRDTANNIRMIGVNLKGCQVKETSLEVSQSSDNDQTPFKAIIVPDENKYDVVYLDEKLCQDNFCKATIDYEGKIVKEPAVFPLKHVPSSFEYYMRKLNDNSGYLVGEVISEKRRTTLTTIYLIRDKDETPQTLYSGHPVAEVGLSTEKNDLSFCVYENLKLVCKRYDAKGKTKKFETAMPFSIGSADSLDAYNLEKGLLVALVGRDLENNERKGFVVHFDEHGEQVKYVNVDLKCDGIGYLKLYEKSNGQYCISYICTAAFPGGENGANFSRSTRCFLKTELF